jgi:ABC-2 type transport system ATP-binding protein
MIEANYLTKRFGRKVAVDTVSFRIEPGRVTGFLGPNGAGKSTTMRLILGLNKPSQGSALVNGRLYSSLSSPLREVGSLLDTKAYHGGRSARNHIRWLAAGNGISRRRADEVLELVGLAEVADKRVATFSLGMTQRLGMAVALLGDPGVLILDEPMNGLDTQGIRWIRGLMNGLAAEGRTVLVSSHVMSEMELTAGHLIVVARGRLIADSPMKDFIVENSQGFTLVRTPEAEELRSILERNGNRIDRGLADDSLHVYGLDAASIGNVASAHGISLHELTPRNASLEDVYTRMTHPAVEFQGSFPNATNGQGAEKEGSAL